MVNFIKKYKDKVPFKFSFIPIFFRKYGEDSRKINYACFMKIILPKSDMKLNQLLLNRTIKHTKLSIEIENLLHKLLQLTIL